MIKRFFAVFMYVSSIPAFACPGVPATSDINFCSSFKQAAPCYCVSSLPPGVPPTICQNMSVIYGAMIAQFGTLEKACKYQHFTTPQICIENWSRYLYGINATQPPCQ